MKHLIICLLIVGFLFIPLGASTSQDSAKYFQGWFKIEVRKNKWVIFEGTKECYLIIDEKNKSFSFGSVHKTEYHIEAEYVGTKKPKK